MPNSAQKSSALRIYECTESLEKFPTSRKYHSLNPSYIGSLYIENINEEDKLVNTIEAINHYYLRSWENAQSSKTKDNIALSFELFLHALKDLNTTDADYINRQFPAYLKHVEELHKRLCREVIGHNIYNSLRIAFWASTAVTLTASVFLVVLPMLLVPTLFGVATAITVGGLLIAAISQMVEGFNKYRSMSRHEENKSNQKFLLNLFAPSLPKNFPYNPDFQAEEESAEEWVQRTN